VIADLGGGIHRVTHRLPWALDHVHCYAIEDPDGWTIVDAGLGTPGTAARWEEALAALGSPRVRRIVVTHYHPDHLGAGADLAELTGAEEIVQGADDAALTRRAWGDERDLDSFEGYLKEHGMPDALAEDSTSDEGGLLVSPPVPTRLVGEGDLLEIAGERYDVLVLPGHADGHIALVGARTGRMFGGDVILEEITPNVGRWEDTRPDPLGAYLDTLRRISELCPSVVYPGHKRPIDNAPRRAREIAKHHEVRLAETEEALQDGAATTYDVVLALWGDGLGFHERRFALVETISHLERLERLGRAQGAGPGRWRAV
jgi:glyoxylase-like metal-dependent hydrolase (beta-lactamase superfamily II)